ncbi:germ cell nuclear acidic protein isoform X2 [Nerophis ophidion]|uniref:germ cell nuclear acidic protein isoform X2 n=1 Tax=Nerophis ophidion TaxID=159077 RepID=UPI002ADF7386|nr:germ cell nuclear acidic protein isoform X2 [Nerophis ophidion]
MNDETCSLFERVSQKMGWIGDNALDIAEKKLMNSVGKKRHNIPSGCPAVNWSISPAHPQLDDDDKENQGDKCTSKVLTESSDDEFDKFLLSQATPKSKAPSKKPRSVVKPDSSNVPVVNSDDDRGNFDKFLVSRATPKPKAASKKPCLVVKTGSSDVRTVDSDDDSGNFDKFLVSRATPKPKAASKKPCLVVKTGSSDVRTVDSDDDCGNFDKFLVSRATPKPKAASKKPCHVVKTDSSDVRTVDSDDDSDNFDKFLVSRATPKPTSKNPCSTVKNDSSNVPTVNSDDDSDFEKFLLRVKTPTAKPKKLSESDDSLKQFIVDDYSSEDDFILTKSSLKGPKKNNNTPATLGAFKKPLSLSRCGLSVFISDSDDDDDNIVVKSTWRSRHTTPCSLPKPGRNAILHDQKNSPQSPFLLPGPSFVFPQPSPHPAASPKHTLFIPSKLDDSSSSEDEFRSLLERLKKNTSTGSSCSPMMNKECSQDPPMKVPAKPRIARSLGEQPLDARTPAKSTTFTVSQTEPRQGPVSRLAVCKTPGCFLESLVNPCSRYCLHFKKHKEELTSKLYQMYNSSVFDNKLPVNMSVTWNKKMRKTAGYCVTGQERGQGDRYARIELSEKVCDSADRLRDTLIHEMCHAATWLINGVRDGHGGFWKLYARKSILVHPELPMVTRCHSYDIKYKFTYQCTRCQNRIGRHSKSLDTQRFVCALCTGQLVLLTPSKPRPPTPFASFVKENYKTVRQEFTGQSHAEVMRKLSADFASKNKVSEN